MKPLVYLFTGITVVGLFFLIGGLAGSHGHFRFRPNQIEDWIIFGTPIIGALGLIFIWTMKDQIHEDTHTSRITGSREFHRLMECLYLAIEKIKHLREGHSSEFASTTEFLTQLQLSRNRLQQSEFKELHKLWIWFGPTGVWDQFVGEEGIGLGTEIFRLTEELKSKVK